MIAKGCTVADIEAAAARAGVGLYMSRHHTKGQINFRLRLINSRWQRISSRSWMPKPRKVGAVCWHGHRQFLRELFSTVPTARVQTCLTRHFGVRWYTAENFEDTHLATTNGYNCPESACLCGSALQQTIEAVDAL